MGLEQENKQALLIAKNLTIGFRKKKEINQVVGNLSFELNKGEILGIVGESGSGKTMTALAIMDLLPKEASVIKGSLLFEGQNLLELKPEAYRKLKGNKLAMIFQEPMTSLNPVMTIGYQIEEMLILHEGQLTASKRKEKTLSSLKEAGLMRVEDLYHKYPHQLSGGMRQRVMIAMAMICKPELLIADEPTTALDVTIQAQILKLIKKLNKEQGTSVILISHDLGVIHNICERTLVMQKGNIVEEGPVKEIFTSPQKEYTQILIAAMSKLSIPKTKRKGDFVTSCSQEECIEGDKVRDKDIDSPPNILEVKNLYVSYEEKPKGLFSKSTSKKVVNNVSFTMRYGESLGIVGESGSGKSTLAKAIVGLLMNKTGDIILAENKPQMVFQDPYGSLNPVKKVNWILEEPLRLSGNNTRQERREKTAEILHKVGLSKEHGERYMSQLSGGQRQRVAIGVALIQNSKFIVLDEPVSALDVTVQAQILDLLKELQEEYELSYLFISHDLKVIYQMCDRVCVMYQGEIVENALIDELFYNPVHSYSKKLLEAIL